MEDSSLCGTSDSEGKHSESMSDSITSLGDNNSTEDISSTGLSDSQQIKEGDKTDDTTDVQKVHVEGHDIKQEEDENEEAGDDVSDTKAEPKTDIIKETERKSDDEEENSEEDDTKPPRGEPFNAPTAEINLVSALKGSHLNEDKPAKGVTWSPKLEEFAPSEDETDESDDQAKGTGKGKKKGGGKNAGEGGSKSNRRRRKKKGRKHGGSSSK